MEVVTVSSFSPEAERVVTNDGMLSVNLTRIKDKNFWGFRRGGQRTTRVSRSNRNDSWNCIRGIPGYFVWEGDIINGNGRYIQIWANTTNRKRIIESVIKCTIVVIYH